VYWFAGIVRALTSRRPDIAFLVVEGRGKAPWLERTGLDPRVYTNLFVMENTPDARDFYSKSRVMLVPSLWSETFGRVAAEAMLNGIPVLASARGGLPETLADAGFVFDIPEKYTPESTFVPTPAEVAPWVDTIIRLYDDAAFYAHEQGRCRNAAEAWRPERLAASYDEVIMSMLLARK
jgi:glycosyltransferase involved in cell wall biosynthesis